MGFIKSLAVDIKEAVTGKCAQHQICVNYAKDSFICNKDPWGYGKRCFKE